MQNNLISILTPFKNSSKFLPECIQSIQDQSHKNWELLIVDDGSNDSSYDIVRAFSKSDSRIQLFKNPGEGIIHALRFAFSKSSGDFITRMDSDDIMCPNKLEVLLSNLNQYGKGFLSIGQVHYFSESGISDGYSKYETWLNNLTQYGTNYFEIYKECVIPSPCWLIRREDLISCEGFRPNFYPEDYDLAFRFYKYNMSCIPCDEVLHKWRDYPNRTSRTHEHYAENHYLELKLNYFLELDFDITRSLVIWGAGKKGKIAARLLQKNNVPFHWVCDNPKKIGKDIYNVTLQSFNFLTHHKNTHVIITVANSQEQRKIKTFLNKLQMQSMKDYFFFC